MKLLWTRSPQPLSKLLCWGLQEPCSHFAVGFNCNAAGTKGTIFQSDLTGSHIAYYGTFLRQHMVVHEIDVGLDVDAENNVYDGIVQAFDGRGYDYRLFALMAWEVALHRLLRRPYPSVMQDANPQRDLCFEAFTRLPKTITDCSSLNWSGFITPELLYRSIDQAAILRAFPTASLGAHVAP